MRYALIDNSTLTSIQRLLGEIPVKNTAIIDNDILAFENYIQAILFYDNIICIDDYKPQYRTNRTSFFPNIRFIPKNYFDYDNFVSAANETTKDITLAIRAGKVSDKDFKNYFDRLNMDFQFTWDMSSSNFFLTQKMLLGNSIINQEHFSALHSMIFESKGEQFEVSAKLQDKKPVLYDSKGNELDLNLETGVIKNSTIGKNASNQFKALVSNLNWISQRSAFYVLAADYLYADLFMQPIRQSFIQNIVNKIYPNYKLGVFNNVLDSINQKSKDSVKAILENYNNFGLSFNIPLFSAYFASKTKNSKKIIEAALNERDNKHFVQARNNLRELNNYLDNNERKKFIREINLLIEETNSNFKSIESKYGLGDKQGFGVSQLKFLFSSIPLIKSINIPKELDPRITKLEFMKHILPKKGFNAIYRDVVKDLLEFDRIGSYKDILISNIEYSKDCFNYGIKTEDPKFVKTSSYWKKPM